MKNTEGLRLEVTEMKMLRWMSEVTKKDRVRNECIRGFIKVIKGHKVKLR